MNNYCMIQNSKTFAFSAENPTGVRAGGSQGGDCTKLRPTVTIPAGETVTLVDAAYVVYWICRAPFYHPYVLG